VSKRLYTTKELQAMTPDELRVARENGFVKNDDPVAQNIAHDEDLNQAIAASSQLTSTDPYAVTTWGSTEYDFRTPSGQMCRMKKLKPEELLTSDLLDRISRLPGFADEEIRKAEGKPPTDKMPSKQDMAHVIETLDELIPMVVVKPTVLRVGLVDPEEGRVPGAVYTDDIELADRIAIMERAMNGVKKLDSFREES
jgi:hypothetical protein